MERSLRQNLQAGAPDRLRVGCTLDEMLEARKAAGIAYRDLGQYGSKLQTAMTTRSPDDLVAHLDDGRIVNVTYRPTQNGCWVSTHEDITERAQNEKDRASGISRPAHRPAEPGGVQRAHRKHAPVGGRQHLVCGTVRRYRSVPGDQ